MVSRPRWSCEHPRGSRAAKCWIPKLCSCLCPCPCPCLCLPGPGGCKAPSVGSKAGDFMLRGEVGQDVVRAAEPLDDGVAHRIGPRSRNNLAPDFLSKKNPKPFIGIQDLLKTDLLHILGDLALPHREKVSMPGLGHLETDQSRQIHSQRLSLKGHAKFHSPAVEHSRSSTFCERRS